MKLATDNYPVDSITDKKVSAAGNPWAKKTLRVGEEFYSLGQIEKEILIPTFRDPRIVFAVSCAAVSCPDRPEYIFDPELLDQQLDKLISVFLTNPKKGLYLDKSSNLLTLSWIFKADKHLFGDDSDIIDFVSRYTPAETAAWLRDNKTELEIDYFEHDWTLNDVAQIEN